MMRTGRILLVEPQDDIRRDLDRQLDLAGHDVAAVPDESDAARLLEEGLDPDVVVLDGDDAGSGTLRRLAPRAVHLRIDRRLSRGRELEETGEPARCPPDPVEVLRRVEELLLRQHTPSGSDPGSRCLDLARRLANALPRTRSIEERIALVTEAFDSFFGVRGTLVVRRKTGGWIEATQAVSNAVVERIGQEITRRSRTRDIRPFLTRLDVAGDVHEVACVAIGIGRDEEVDLALVLERAPSQPGQREALMNLVGSAVRASAAAAELEQARMLAEIQGSSLEALLEATRELGATPTASELPRRLLAILRRDLLITRSALFAPGDGGPEPIAVSGVPAERLAGVRLAGLLPADRPAPAATEVRAIAELGAGAPSGEREALEALGLRWVAAFPLDDDRTGFLAFGRTEDAAALEGWERRLLAALLGAAVVAQRGLDRLDELAEVSAGSLRGLVAATELANPWDRGHAERVARAAIRLGRAMGMSGRKLSDLSLAAMLHDVGKVATGPDPERTLRMHPALGATLLSHGLHSADVIQGVEQHHERFDGAGHPRGLAGEAIHLFGRILAIANDFDRMTRASERPLPAEEALARLEAGAGRLYDPALVALFVENVVRAPAEDRDAPGELWLRPIAGPGAAA